MRYTPEQKREVLLFLQERLQEEGRTYQGPTLSWCELPSPFPQRRRGRATATEGKGAGLELGLIFWAAGDTKDPQVGLYLIVMRKMGSNGRPTSDELQVVSGVEPAWLERVFGLVWDALPPREVPLSFFFVPLFLPKRKTKAGLPRFAKPETNRRSSRAIRTT